MQFLSDSFRQKDNTIYYYGVNQNIMPRGFTDVERENIRDKLLSIAKGSLTEHGFSKISVKKLTEKAGISKGAFYIFYETKEALLLDLLKTEEQQLREELENLVADRNNLEDVFTGIYSSLINNAIMKLLTNEEELNWLLRKLPPNTLEENIKDDDNYFAAFFSSLKDEGVIKSEVDIKLLTVLPRLLFILKSQEEFLSASDHNQFVKFVIQAISEYINS